MAEQISIKKRLAAGQGIREAITGGLKAKKNYYTSKKGIAKTFFSGNDLFSSFVRGKLNPEDDDEESPNSLSNKSLTSITKNVSIIKNVVSFLLKFEKENLEQRRRLAQIEYLKQQDAKEAALESQRKSPSLVKSKNATDDLNDSDSDDESGGGGGGLLALLGGLTLRKFLKKQLIKIFKALKSKIVKVFKAIFTKKNFKTAIEFMKKNFLKFAKLGGRFVALASGPVGWAVLIAFLIGEGIWNAWKKWKETGELGATIKSFFAGVINGITFGLIGTENIEEGIDKGIELWDRLKAYMTSLGADILAAVKEKFGNVIVSIGKFISDKTKDVPVIGKVGSKVGNALIEYGSKLLGESAKLNEQSAAQIESAKSKKPKTQQSNKTTPEKSKPLSEEDIIKEKAKDIIGMDVSNMSDEEIEKIIPKGTKLEDFEVDIDGKLQAFGSMFGNSKSPSPVSSSSDIMNVVDKGDSKLGAGKNITGGLGGLVQQFGGDEATAGLQKDSDKLGNFMQGGGLADKFGQLGNDSSNISGSMDKATSSISAKIKAGGVTPEPITPFGGMTGSAISQSSSDVEYGQREEMTSPGGNIFNSPQITNNSSTTGSKKIPPADVFNSDFAKALMRT